MSESTDTITIRVPKLLKEQLEKTSKKNQVNLNLLINQILTKKMHWDEQLTKLGWLPMDPFTVKEIIHYLTDEAIIEISKNSSEKVIKGILFIYGDTSLSHVVEFIDSWLDTANMTFRHTEDSQSHKFLVHHDLGRNWSLLSSKVIDGFITKSGYKISDPIEKDDSYSFTISK